MNKQFRLFVFIILVSSLVVGIAIMLGTSVFSTHSTQANRDGVTIALVRIAADAYQFRIRPHLFGGGGNSYTGYAIPSRMSADANGTYSLVAVTERSCQIKGVSAANTDWVAICTADDTGNTRILYDGW